MTTALPDITFEAYLGGSWVDLTSRLLHDKAAGGRQVEITEAGRQNELDQAEPARLSLALKNTDGELIPGNPLSSYPDWRQGVQVRLTETVNAVDVRLFTGYLQIPDVAINLPDKDQPVAISAVDILGRLLNAPPFDGILAAWVATDGYTDLVDHWPLTEQSRPFMSAVTGSEAIPKVAGFFDEPVPAEKPDLLKCAETDGPPGDDQKYASFEPVGDSEGDAYLGRSHLVCPVDITLADDDTITVQVWYRASTWATVDAAHYQPPQYPVQLSGPNLTLNINAWDGDANGIGMHAFNAGASTSQDISSTKPWNRDAWRLITAQLDTSTGGMSLWIGNDYAGTATLSGTLTGPYVFTTLTIGEYCAGAIGHVQVRTGGSFDYLRSDHQAQHLHGFRGLERQTVSERVVTVATMAGVPISLLTSTATASALMQKAKLAGVKPVDALKVAATTGGDTLLTNRSGQVTLAPRTRRYGQATTYTIPYGWLDLGLTYRQDQAINYVTAKVTDAGTVRRRGRASILDVGQFATSFDLATAVPSDAGNLAQWTVDTYTTQRVRCPKLRINLLPRTQAERQSLLGLAVGDRITLSGRPSTAPADASDLIVQGIRHEISCDSRYLELNTSPMLGPAAGTPPVCAIVGTDVADPSTLTAY